jgi:hypothetical protein
MIYTARLQQSDVNAHGPKSWHLPVLTVVKYLVGVCCRLILYAAASSYHDTIPPIVVDCDNNGVVIHRNNSLGPLPTNQSQADLLQVFKHLVSTQPFLRPI